jgi:hypothetical protein
MQLHHLLSCAQPCPTLCRVQPYIICLLLLLLLLLLSAQPQMLG